MRAVLVVGALVLACCGSAPAATLPPDWELRPLATGLDAPTAAAWAPDGRLFVAERQGRVRVVVGGTLQPDPLLDIRDHVSSFGDRGLLGIAVDADFAENHFLYLLYTYEDPDEPPPNDALDDEGPKTSRLTRVTVRPDNTPADPSSPETVIVGREDTAPCPAPANDLDCIPSDGPWHSIGTVRADPDGTLWLGSGDATPNDFGHPDALRTYDERTYVGKLVHVDRDGNGLPGHAFCPSEDDLTLVCTKLYAKGLRNPYRFALRGGGLGPIVGDVGFFNWEEVNVLDEPGGNYGWPCYEHDYEGAGWQDHAACTELYAADATTGAAFAYHHSIGGTAIVGGPLYPGGPYPDAFDGSILVGDYGGAWIRRVRFPATGAPVLEPWIEDVGPLDLALAPSGNLAYVDHGNFEDGAGSVREVAYCPDHCAPVARLTATPSHGSLPLAVQFDASASTDSDGDPLTFSWDFGDGTTGTGATADHEYTTPGVRTATVTVSDGTTSETASVPISAGNHPPVPAVGEPGPFVVGDEVTIEGSAVDPENGLVPGGELEWRVHLIHGDHIHPYALGTGPSTTVATDPAHDADSYYEVRLAARDAEGLLGTRTVELRPRTVDLTLASDPPGAPVTYVARTAPAPLTLDAAVGFEAQVAASEGFTAEGRTFAFERWSDGGARVHVAPIPDAPATLTAIYRDVSAPTGETGRPVPGSAPSLAPDRLLEGPVDAPLPDRAGPAVGVARAVIGARLRGTAADPSGVRSVLVALRARRGRAARCRWWSTALGRLTQRRTACAAPRWARATLTPRGDTVAWELALRGTPARGRYDVLLRAVDGAGNETARRASARRGCCPPGP